MPGLIVTQATAMTCFHAAPVLITPAQPRVLVMGTPAVTVPSQLTVAACPFPPTGTPHPCVLIKWANVAARVTIMGAPVLLQTPPTGTGNGACLAADQAPQGLPVVGSVQPKVIAT